MTIFRKCMSISIPTPLVGSAFRMKLFCCLALLLLSPALIEAQSGEAYGVFDAKGKRSSFEKMIKEVAKADIVFFGEIHNNSLNHWLELQLTKALHEEHGNDLVVAMEMFEADNQMVVDEYMSGLIEERHLLAEAKIWDNYKTDYKPIVDFAKENKLKLVASNIPRRYANLVYRKGAASLNDLPEEAKKWIAPVPLEIDLSLPGYKEMITSMGGHGTPASAENLASSQASKDATMAWFIAQSLPGKVLHLNGSYHSKNGEGIIWYLQKTNPQLTIATIHCVEQESIGDLEATHEGMANFIIAIPSDMTKTY